MVTYNHAISFNPSNKHASVLKPYTLGVSILTIHIYSALKHYHPLFAVLINNHVVLTP
jgi:hypothetical protein